jgi:hypothetical protein
MKLATFVSANLGIWGASLAVYSFWVLKNIPLTALGLGAVVISASIISTYSESPYSEAALTALEAYTANLARILEEFGASQRAIYLKDGFILAPLSSRIDGNYPSNPDRMVFGSRGCYYLVLEGPKLPAEGDPEAALTGSLVDTLGVCDAVRVVSSDYRITVELRGVRISEPSARFTAVLGPVPVHLAATALAKAMGKDLIVKEWREEKRRIVATIEVIERAGEG